MSRFLSKRLDEMEAYVPGEQPRDKKYIKLNTNESPFPPCPGVINAVSGNKASLLNLYPDPTCTALKEKLAKVYNLKSENIFISNGSDDILNFAFLAFCDGGRGMAFADITYGFYSVFAELYGVKTKIIPLKDDFKLNCEAFENLGMNAVIANPNAPTGLPIEQDDLRRILETNRDSVIIADEAYVDFGGKSALPLISEYDNLLVVRTFSKSRSMAGARLGFAMANPELIRDLEKIKYSTNPYDINTLTQAAGIACLDDAAYFESCVNSIIKAREYTTKQLKSRGFIVTDSAANFVFAKKPGYDGEELYNRLRQKGVLVRHFSKERIKDYLRITIGTIEQMDKLLAAIDEIIG